MRIASVVFCALILVTDLASAQPKQRFDANERKYTIKVGSSPSDWVRQLSEQSGLPIIGTVPKRSAIICPEWPSVKQESRKYTFNEMLEIINELVIYDGKNMLIRTDKGLAFVSVDERPMPWMVPRIPIAELSERSKLEFVELIMPLRKDVDVEEKAVLLKRLLGDFSRVTTIDAINSLIVQAHVRNLRVSQFLWEEWLERPAAAAHPPVAMPCPCPPPPCPPRRILFPRLRLR